MHRINHILFDLGSTLIYFEGSRSDVLLEGGKQMYLSLSSAGVHLDEEAFQRMFLSELERYYKEREQNYIESTTFSVLQSLLRDRGYHDVPDSVIHEALKAMYTVTQDHWYTAPYTKSVLETLVKDGFRLGIISNAADDNDVQTLVKKADLQSFFDFVITSAAIGVRKPSSKIFNIALNRWEALPTNTAMVGDKLEADIKGAQSVGIFSIWVTQYAHRPNNRRLIGVIEPDATIESLQDLLPLLMSLNQ